MPGLISPATLEQIRAASDIVEVIGGYLPLKRAGANFVALCPFHKEKSPSFNVHPARQIFHCFGCHKGGDVFTFVKEYESIGFLDAVRRLAERANIVLEFEQSDAEQQSRHIKDRLLEVHEQICRRWQNALANEAAGQLAREYLARRGVSADAAQLFRLGAAPEAWDDTVNWAKAKGHDLALVEQGGLIIRKEETGNYYDRFRGRLMFPISDEQGRVIGFSGRVLRGDEKTAKYVNSPETPIFTKSKVFFGLDKSKRAVLDAGFAIVCEGQLDLIACFMAGVQNVVAPQGTALTADHARILKRYVDEVVLCFDSDEAGQNAAVRSLDHLLASGVAVRVAVVPAPHDPDSFIQEQGGEAFRALIGRAEGFFDYYLTRLCRLYDAATDKGRLAVLREIGAAVLKTANAVLIDSVAQKAALRLGVSPDAVRLEFRKLSRTGQPSAPGDEPPDTAAGEAEPGVQELWLLRLLFLNDEFPRWLAVNLDLNWVQHPRVRQIMSQRLAAVASENWLGVAAFLAGCEDDATRELVSAVTVEDRPIPYPARQLQDVVQILRNQFLDRQLAALIQRASQPETGEAERLALLRQQQEVRRLKLQPLTPPADAAASPF